MKSIIVIVVLILILCFILGYYYFPFFQEGLENQKSSPPPAQVQNASIVSNNITDKHIGQMDIPYNNVSPSVSPSSLVSKYHNNVNTTTVPINPIATPAPTTPSPSRTDYGTNVAQHCLTIKNTIDTLKSIQSKLTPQEQAQVQAEILGLEKIQFILRC
jgi:hypothetical protein